MNTESHRLPKWMWIVCGLMVVGAIVLFVMVNIVSGDFRTKYSENNVKIGDLQEQIAALDKSINTIDTEEVVSDRIMSCADLGNKVAELQTNYQNLSAADDEAAFMENVYALDACLGENDKNSRVPWYQILSDYDITWVWEFQSTYEFASVKVNVIWLCRDAANGDLLAYVTGVYDSTVGVFTNIECKETSIGYTYRYKSLDESGGNEATSPTELIDINGDGVIDENDIIDAGNASVNVGNDDKPSSGNIVDNSTEPAGIGSGGVGGYEQKYDDNDESNDSDESGSFGDDFQDYDDYIGSEP